MELFQRAIHEKLVIIDEERGRWQQYTNDYLQAGENLLGFRESLQRDVLVPIGSKALMPGKLYHTNEILVGMYGSLFVKCSAQKAMELCHHRLRKAKERMDALDAEYKKYSDRIDVPVWEDALGNSAEAREIIEVYNEDEEKKWREEHRIRVREQKQREAVERREQMQAATNDSEDVMEILERAELMEELENELEELNVMNDEQLHQHLHSNGENGLSIEDDNRATVDDGNDNDDYFFEEDVAPEEFQCMSREAAALSTDAKLKFYQNHLDEIGNYLATRKFTALGDLAELADKRAVQECLRNAIEEIGEEDRNEKSAATAHNDLEMDERSSNATQRPSDGRKCLTIGEFKQLEQPYLNRSKGVALVFYKGQLRSVMKSIASCSRNAHHEHADEKRELYEYINDAIDRLRAEILREKQAKFEEKFVDDDTDNEATGDCDIDMIIEDNDDDDDVANETDAPNADSICIECHNDTASSDPTPMVSPTKRKICFAAQPSVTTYHLDDEPWRVQSALGNVDETINSLMDETFQFFNSPSSSSSNSVCDYDGHDSNTGTDNMRMISSSCDDDCAVESISQQFPSTTTSINYRDETTLYLKFSHTAMQTASDQSSNITRRTPTANVNISSPIDIYQQFGNQSAASANDADDILEPSSNDCAESLDAAELQQKLTDYMAGNIGSSSLPNGNHTNVVAATDDHESVVVPKKSILKNCEAVKQEIHGKIYDQIDDDDAALTFYTQEKCSPFVGFDQVLGNICERPNEVTCNNNNNGSSSKNNNNIETIGNDRSGHGKRRVSLFKLNRMS